MQAIRSSETTMELYLYDALLKYGVRFGKNVESIFGKPDLAIKKYKIAVFVDGEYFHGKNWSTSKFRIQTNREFWWKKIEGNIMRDKLVTKYLKHEGWKVLRFWSNDVKKNVSKCCERIMKEVNKRKNGN